jgi:hypothetical protein
VQRVSELATYTVVIGSLLEADLVEQIAASGPGLCVLGNA